MSNPDQQAPSPSPVPSCPKCGGEMWDNREGKRNPRAPDFKCKDRSCDGVIWPPRTAAAGAGPPLATSAAATTTTTTTSGSAGPSCPICGGPMWDDRATKRNPRAPDFKCKNKPKYRGGPGCEGVIWPPRDGKSPSAASASSRGGSGGGGSPAPRSGGLPATGARPAAGSGAPAYEEGPPPYNGPPPDDDDLLPF